MEAQSKMANTLRKIGLAGLAVLAFAECNPNTDEILHGTFRGFETTVTKSENKTEIEMLAPAYDFNLLRATAFNSKLFFNEIDLVQDSVDGKRGILPDSPLQNYENQDSLEAAYDSVVAQTLKREEWVK